MYYSEEQIQRANSQSITEYFSRNGYPCERSGREMHIRGFGGFMVDESTQKYYIHSQQKGGIGLVNCLMKVFDLKFPEAVSMALNGEQPVSHNQDKTSTFASKFPTREFAPAREKEVKIFTMPQRAADNKRIFAYLNKQRRISPKTINALISANLLYQDVKGNAIFLDVKNNVPCGAEFHGTSAKKYTIGKAEFSEIENRQIIQVKPYIAEQLSEILKNNNQVNYVGFVYEKEANIAVDPKAMETIKEIVEALENSELNVSELNERVNKKLKSFNGVAYGTADNYFEYKKSEFPQKAYVFESAIDLMSFIDLHPEISDCEYVSMGGLKPSVVNDLLDKGLKVVLCVDNDDKGRAFCERFAGQCTVFTECHRKGVKDFNELLQKVNPKENFFGAIEKMSKWSDKVQEKAATAREAITYERNQSLQAQYVR